MAKPATTAAYRYAATPAQAGRAAGYAPPVSELAPDGYALKAVATFAAGYQPEDWVHAAGGKADRVIPPAEPAVAQLYTRGLSWFTLEQIGPKPAPSSAPAWTTPSRSPRRTCSRSSRPRCSSER